MREVKARNPFNMIEDIDNAMEGLESEKKLIKRFDKVAEKIIESGNYYSKEELIGVFKLKDLHISFRSNGKEIAFIQSARVTTVIPTSSFKHGVYIAKSFEEPESKNDETEINFTLFLIFAFITLLALNTLATIKTHIDFKRSAAQQFCIIEKPTLEFVGKSDIELTLIKGKLNCKSGMKEKEIEEFESTHAVDELAPSVTAHSQINSGIEFLPSNTKFYADRKAMQEQFDAEVERRKSTDPKFDVYQSSKDESNPVEIKVNTQPPAPGYVSIIAFVQDHVNLNNE
jgi:hypothetical protein